MVVVFVVILGVSAWSISRIDSPAQGG